LFCIFFSNKYFRGKIKKRKNQIDSYKSKISTDEDHLQFSLNLDDLQKQKEIKNDQHHVIEQFFPDASILGPQLLVPNQKRIFIELDFAKEQNIEDYQKQYEENNRDQRRDVKRQTKTHLHTIEEEEELIISDTKTEEEKEQSSILKLPSDEKGYIEDQSIEISENKSKEDSVEQQYTQPSVEKYLSEADQTATFPLIKDEQQTKDELQKPLTSDKTIESSLFIAEILASSTESLLSKSTSIVLPNTTEDLITILSDS
jgi:hypothetical protein